MEAKDTVMSNKKMSKICGCSIEMICSAGDYEWKIAEAQAEISFKAGIREVVEDFTKWFDTQSWDINGGAYIIPKTVMKIKLAKLREWGV